MNSYFFKNNTPVTINSEAPNRVQSSITVTGINARLTAIRLKLNLNHSYTSDLVLKLLSPSGQSITLLSNVGGSGDNFVETEFSDSATASIREQVAPFTGSFIPEEPLAQLMNGDANGIWTLEVDDQASQDGGILTEWQLNIDTVGQATLPLVYNNMTPQTISSEGQQTVISEINIDDQLGIHIQNLSLTLDIEHSYVNDLDVRLEAPDGEQLTLVAFHGGSGDNFEMTEFSDEAENSIRSASPPFLGSFKPQDSLGQFNGKAVNGIWKLIIRDTANQDGGILHFWKLCIIGDQATPAPESPFHIDVRFIGGLTASQQAVFEEAAQRWSEAIVGDLPSFQIDGEVIDDLLILAEGINIDGSGGVLGKAGPTHVRPDSRLPIKGIMQFDSADLAQMEQSGELLDVIIHEMGHVLGIGTLWSEMRLISGSGTNDPLFIGPSAMREYGRLLGTSNPTAVPVANTGGPGTREGHWREATFDTELMTGYDDPGRNAMSRMTIASLQDLGYQVNIEAADHYSLPLRVLSLETIERKMKHECIIHAPPITVVSAGARIT